MRKIIELKGNLWEILFILSMQCAKIMFYAATNIVRPHSVQIRAINLIYSHFAPANNES